MYPNFWALAELAVIKSTSKDARAENIFFIAARDKADRRLLHLADLLANDEVELVAVLRSRCVAGIARNGVEGSAKVKS